MRFKPEVHISPREYSIYRILPSTCTCLNKRAPNFWIWLAISQKLINWSESSFKLLKLRHSRVHTASYWTWTRLRVFSASTPSMFIQRNMVFPCWFHVLHHVHCAKCELYVHGNIHPKRALKFECEQAAMKGSYLNKNQKEVKKFTEKEPKFLLWYCGAGEWTWTLTLRTLTRAVYLSWSTLAPSIILFGDWCFPLLHCVSSPAQNRKGRARKYGGHLERRTDHIKTHTVLLIGERLWPSKTEFMLALNIKLNYRTVPNKCTWCEGRWYTLNPVQFQCNSQRESL